VESIRSIVGSGSTAASSLEAPSEERQRQTLQHFLQTHPDFTSFVTKAMNVVGATDQEGKFIL
jgi:hypothetical protein